MRYFTLRSRLGYTCIFIPLGFHRCMQGIKSDCYLIDFQGITVLRF